MILLCPDVANASTLVGSYDIPTDADNVACDWFGYDYNTMDAGLKALLHSSTTTGGAGTDSNPNFAGYAAFRNSLFSPAIAGDYQWYSNYDGFMFVDAADKARADIEGAIRWWDEYGGETAGGGGSGEGGYHDGMMTFDCTSYKTDFAGSTWSVYSANSGFDVIGYISFAWDNNPNTGNKTPNAPETFNSLIEGEESYFEGATSIFAVRVNSSIVTYVLYGSYTLTDGQNGRKYITYSGPIRGVSNGRFVGSSIYHYGMLASAGNVSLNAEPVYFGGDVSGGSGGGSGGGGGGGPVPEPEPTVPAPDDKPTYDTNINVNGSINIDNSTTGTTEFELDISELLDILKKINDNLVDFAEDFHNMWEWWAEEMANVESDLNRFSSNVTTWLQMIYNKISSSGSSKPDVYVNPDNGLNWFEEILARLLEAMPEGLQDLITTLAELRGVFPFSIPWDLGLILSTLAGQPVTPVVDIPYPYGLNRISYIRVDLTPWDGVAYQIRRGIFIVFAGGLALNTKKLLGLVEVN